MGKRSRRRDTQKMVLARPPPETCFAEDAFEKTRRLTQNSSVSLSYLSSAKHHPRWRTNSYFLSFFFPVFTFLDFPSVGNDVCCRWRKCLRVLLRFCKPARKNCVEKQKKCQRESKQRENSWLGQFRRIKLTTYVGLSGWTFPRAWQCPAHLWDPRLVRYVRGYGFCKYRLIQIEQIKNNSCISLIKN